MKQLSKLQSALFLMGGVFMVIGVGCFVFGLFPTASSIVFLMGGCVFAAMQIAQRYEGKSITIRRLRRIMMIADVCFVLSGALMLEQAWHIVEPYMTKTIGGYTAYIQLFRNNWVVTLLIGALLEMYTMHRISMELEKEQAKTEKTLKDE